MGTTNYKDTLKLPKTAFPMKANLPKREPDMLRWWEEHDIYHKMVEHRDGAPRYIMHDGPPYANGHIHHGHILNKVLKDIVVKYKNMSGFSAPFVPGWDCHGLPIERTVEDNLSKAGVHATPQQLRKKCRTFAAEFVGIQKEEFKRLGVLADWDDPYLTMNYHYEARIAREFGTFVAKDLVYQGQKPVYWCPVCKTALAEAEVEYKDVKSPSIYVKFPFTRDVYERFPKLKGKNGFVVIWTTTPWTLPSNLAISLHPDFTYVAEQVGDEVLILAEDLTAGFHQATGVPTGEVLMRAKGKEFEGLHCRHPFLDQDSLLIVGEHVTLDAGTGCVHTAPGHGQEDYEVGIRYGLKPYAPVDEEGRFTRDVPMFEGRFVFDCDKDVIALLKERDMLIKASQVEHSYPHCWRSHDPVIFRATPQWFIGVDRKNLRQDAISAIQDVKFIPPQGKTRLTAMLEGRPDWCISRQRHWGVPIIAFKCKTCGHTLLDASVVAHVADIFEEHSADAWFEMSEAELLPAGTKCPECGGTAFEKDSAILDVWFDSGVSHAAVVKRRYGADARADLYLEGSDQHRGWFQSSLLASVGARGEAPYKSVVTHGFVVDGEGKKLSKSARNFVAPQKTIDRQGAEIFRLWVAAENYKEDIRISDQILRTLVDSYRKFRNTFRFMLGNLGDFDPSRDMVPDGELLPVDRYALANFGRLVQRVLDAYDAFDLHVIYQNLVNYTFTELSAFYLDITKDRLYCEAGASPKRRSAQTGLYRILRGMLLMLAPVLSFTAEEAYQQMPKLPEAPESIFLCDMVRPQDFPVDEQLDSKFGLLREVRTRVLAVLEQARGDGQIGHPLEASIALKARKGSPYLSVLHEFGAFLPELFVVSAVTVEEFDGPDAFDVAFAHAPGGKCQRCWNYSTTVGSDPDFPDVCARCAGVLRQE